MLEFVATLAVIIGTAIFYDAVKKREMEYDEAMTWLQDKEDENKGERR